MLFKVRAPQMVRVTLWPQLLLVVLILRQSAAVSDQCSEMQDRIFRLERDLLSMRELKDMNQLRAGKCEQIQEDLRKQVVISQATTKEFNKTVAVNNDLKKQLEVKEEVLKIINEKQTQLQTTIDGLTKTVDTVLCETTKNVCRSLLDAAKSGDVDSARRLVKCDSNDNCTDHDDYYDKYYHTPLTYAARYGHMEVVWVLLEGGANVDRANPAQRTALHWAARFGHLDVCRLLLDWGAKVDPLDMWQHTPLHYAARDGHLSVAKLLVERGADVSVKDVWGRTASDAARRDRKKDVADWLDTVCRHLLDAAKSGNVNTVKILFKYSNDSCTDDNCIRDTPLTYAAWYGHVGMVRVLLEGGANVDRADALRRTSLHVAALCGHLDVCRLLLDWGAKVDHLNKWKHTPLHLAAERGELSVLKLLVERGADVSVKGEKGQTASDVARYWGLKDVADWLDSVRCG